MARTAAIELAEHCVRINVMHMGTKYLLPCDCGAKLLVDATESGLTKACACGALLEVPTLRGLSKLERAAEDEPAIKTAWGARQRGIAVGAIVAVLGFAFGIYASFAMGMTAREFCQQEKMPVEPPPPEDLPPAMFLRYWHHVERQGLASASDEAIEKFQRTRRVRHLWMGVGYGLGLVGLAMIGCSIAFARGPVPMRRGPVAAPRSQSAER